LILLRRLAARTREKKKERKEGKTADLTAIASGKKEKTERKGEGDKVTLSSRRR